MIILSIDTSADETSVAITKGFNVLSSVIYSQINTHKSWGGIVPHIAKFEHQKKINNVVERCISKCISLGHIKRESDIRAIAVTYGPGLSPALEVGINKAKELSKKLNVPLIAVNHMEGHLYSAFLQNSKANVEAPKGRFLAVLVSGGHTELVDVAGNGKYAIIGQTKDDAAGEALDKASKMLGLGYPGGAIIEALSQQVQNQDLYKFPRPMISSGDYDFSFSGLKTHLFYFLKGEKGYAPDISRDLHKIASSFQEAVFDCILKKVFRYVKSQDIKTITLGGGVAVNKRYKKLFQVECRKHGIRLIYPKYKYMYGDNAAMIGAAAYMVHMRSGFVKGEFPDRVPRLKITD